VLLNVHLRGPLDGPAVATRLRTHSPSPIPVVFVATSADDFTTYLPAVVPMAALAGPLLAQYLHRALASALGW
jgi:DNA-binding LytR/AlgR family response regulator